MQKLGRWAVIGISAYAVQISARNLLQGSDAYQGKNAHYSLENSFSCLLEPLYWKASGEGLDFVEKVSTNSSLHGTLESLHFDWDWGFQLGLGYRIPHDAWQGSLGLKHIHTNAYGNKSSEDGYTLFPLWHTLGTTIGEVEHAVGHWRLHLGLLDLLLSRSWMVTSRLNAAISSGLRTSWIRQKYQIQYLAEDGVSSTSLSMKNKFWGLGPAFGGSIDWKVTAHWSLFSELLFSILYGTFYLHQAEWEEISKEDLLGIHKSFKSSATTFDMSLGVRWQQQRRNGALKWALEIAWDQVILPRQGQWVRFVSSMAPGDIVSAQGDLSLKGLRFGILFSF